MQTCALCNEQTENIMDVAENWLIDAIKKDHPEWVQGSGACPKCIEYYSSLDEEISVED
ncbi:MAG: hypothetical protein GWO07_13275 [Candidatus Dadabacteria bacterium]|nr:hypothetical protein [Candidatus Dadabacteria bacterium]NIV40980.1 hypothetical protein [Candidatus Dadabacteria bacterium]